jgi:dienelactone hydrolase
VGDDGGTGRRTERRRRIRGRLLVPTLVVGCVAAVVAAGYLVLVTLRHDRPVTLPALTGRFAVGRATFDWTDGTRTDPLAPRPGTARELAVWLWYPAPPGTRGPQEAYAPGAWGGLHLSGPPGLAQTRFDAIRTRSVQAAPVAAGRFPVVVLEPGMGLAAPQYTALAEALASHGYLVAGVTPTYSANLTVLDGQPVPATTAGNPSDLGPHTGPAGDRADALLTLWAEDARFTAGQVDALDRGGRFAGHVDAGPVVYLGHSFGGAASLQACHDDPHCAGAVDLDGTQFGDVVHTGLSVPLMIIGEENSCVIGECRTTGPDDVADLQTAHSLLAASTGPRWTLSIDGAQHFNVTDYAMYYLAAPLRRLIPLGTIRGELGLTITAGYLDAFLTETTQHTAAPLLHGAAPYPQVRMQPQNLTTPAH